MLVSSMLAAAAIIHATDRAALCDAYLTARTMFREGRMTGSEWSACMDAHDRADARLDAYPVEPLVVFG